MKPGDKVVCVDDGPCEFCGENCGAVKNQIYVLSNVYQDAFELRVKCIGANFWCACKHDDGHLPAIDFHLLRPQLLQTKEVI